jgi:hypothetical protein
MERLDLRVGNFRLLFYLANESLFSQEGVEEWQRYLN